MIHRKYLYSLVIALSIWLVIAFGVLAVKGDPQMALDNGRAYIPVVVGEGSDAPPITTPSATPTSAETATKPSETTPTASTTASGTPSPTIETATATPATTATATITTTPTATATNTSTPTATASPTATVTPTASPTPTQTPKPNPPPTGDNVTCEQTGLVEICAWVSDGTPKQYTNVTVYGRLLDNGKPVANAPMHTEWHYKTVTQPEDCVTDKKGIGRCTRSIHSATEGYEVVVDVSITHKGITYRTKTWFVPHK